MSRRCIGLDVHREFAQVAIWEAGVVRQAGRIATTPEALRLTRRTVSIIDSHGFVTGMKLARCCP